MSCPNCQQQQFYQYANNCNFSPYNPIIQYECSCRRIPQFSFPESILSMNSGPITYGGNNSMTYYSLGNGTNTNSNSILNTVTANTPVAFLFPRDARINKIVAKVTILSQSSSVTISGMLSVGVQLYTALPINNGSQMTYINNFNQPINNINGIVTAGSTYFIESNLNVNVTKNSSIAVIFTANNTANENIDMVFNAALLYC